MSPPPRSEGVFEAGSERLWSLLGRLKRRSRLILIILLLGIVVVTLGVGIYLETPARGDSERLAAIDDREDIQLERVDGDYYIQGGPITDETVGLVIYPGARVHPDSYVPTLAPIVAESDVLIVIPEMPLNLAVFNSGAAANVAEANPEINRWAVGGHSLGGAMACRHTARGADVDGLLLLAAYCDDDDDLREVASSPERNGADGVHVLSVQGTEDGVIDRERERANRPLLGPNASIVSIEGMNHAQFGAYGDQRGDNPATISDEAAGEYLVVTILEWLGDDLGVNVSERSEEVPNTGSVLDELE